MSKRPLLSEVLTRKIALNTVVMVIGQGVGWLTTLAAVGLLTRYLGTSGYGTYTTVFAYLAFFTVFNDLGLRLVTVREISAESAQVNRIASNALSLRLALSVLVVLTAAVAATVLPYPHVTKVGIVLVALSLIPTGLKEGLASVFESRLKLGFVVIGESLAKVVFLGLVVLAVRNGLGLLYLVGAYAVAGAAAVIWNWLTLRRLTKLRLSFDFAVWRDLAGKALPLSAISILGIIYYRVDTVMLSLMKSPVDVGVYGLAYKFFEIMIAFPGLFMASVFPVLARFNGGPRRSSEEVFRKSFDFLFALAMPIMVGLIILAPEAVHLLGGSDFNASILPLRILALGSGCVFLSYLAGRAVIAAGKQHKLIAPYLTAMALNVAGNLMLIPSYSYVGAAVTTALTEALMMLFAFHIARRHAGLAPSLGVAKVVGVASITMGAIVFELQPISVAAAVAAGAATYVVCFGMLSGWRNPFVPSMAPEHDRMTWS